MEGAYTHYVDRAGKYFLEGFVDGSYCLDNAVASAKDRRLLATTVAVAPAVTIAVVPGLTGGMKTVAERVFLESWGDR